MTARGLRNGAEMRWTDILPQAVKRRGNSLLSWGTAIAFFLVTLAVRSALPSEAGRLPFVAFFPAIIATVLICGLLQGVVVLFLSVVAGWYLFLPPVHTFPRSSDDVISLIAFVFAATLLLAVVEGLAQAILKAEDLALANADLFRELQHCVANNFQIVSATLQKGRRTIADPAALAAIDTAISRVQAMAAMHRGLYDATSYSSGLQPVLITVVAEVFDKIPVSVEIAISARKLTLGEMTAITLLVNEAAINAAKHVFRPARGSRFEIMLSESEPSKLELLIRDDGPGIPREVQAADGRPRFGLAVMRSLAQQLGGSLELPERAGGVLRVEFQPKSLG
jgi:two-component sensor histidine kinase